MIMNAFGADYNLFVRKRSYSIEKDKIIHLNGVFDIFHIEHLRMINWTKKQFPGHKILIAINSDKSVKKMNKSHPLIFNERYRSEFLSELVDYVVLYDDFYDYLQIIKDVGPEFIVKGDEYFNKDIPEKHLGINIAYYFSNSEMSSTQVYESIIEKFRLATEI